MNIRNYEETMWIQKPKKKLWMFMVNVLSFANGQGMWFPSRSSRGLGSHGERTAAIGSTGSTTQKADGTECAHVLCFDWERGAWVPETVEIPAIDAAATTELSEGLKVLIGAGMGRRSGAKIPGKCGGNGGERSKTMQKMRMWWPCVSYPLVNIQKTMENHHFQWVNPLFLWPCSIANC